MTSTQLDRSALLEKISQELDIPPHLDALARKEYYELAQYLAQYSKLAPFQPYIYPQGSYRLGTVIMPLIRKDGYDVDNVCRLLIKKANITQAELKALIGEALRDSPRYKSMLKEKRRCWTLLFSAGFHIDVLPAITNDVRLPNGILITDKELRLWQWSNPIDYADWFQNQQQTVWEKVREQVALARGGTVDKVPDHEVKTPLQRAIQLMKRHRDLMFINDPDNKPISIIITTLAARAYDGSTDLAQALRGMVHRMPQYLEDRNGRTWVVNPVEPGENFADKWQQFPERERAFRRWHGQLLADVEELISVKSVHLRESLARQFGDEVANAAFRGLGQTAFQGQVDGTLRALTTTGVLSLSAHAGAQSLRIPGHNFYGADEA